MTEVRIRVHLLDYSVLPPVIFRSVYVNVDPSQTFDRALESTVRAPQSPIRDNEAWDVGLIAGPSQPESAAGIAYFTPAWIVREDGSLEYCVTPHGLRRHTPGDVQRAVSSGLLDASTAEFVIYPSAGTGGDGGQEILNWLFENVGNEVVFGVLGFSLSPAMKNLLWFPATRRARSVAAAWAEQQLFSPYQLRVIVDRKLEWSSSELGSLLRVNPDIAKNLLRALGYQRNARSSWQMGVSKKAKERRARWMDAEPKDPMGNAFSLSPRGLAAK